MKICSGVWVIPDVVDRQAVMETPGNCSDSVSPTLHCYDFLSSSPRAMNRREFFIFPSTNNLVCPFDGEIGN
jgi:hypothetical protein